MIKYIWGIFIIVGLIYSMIKKVNITNTIFTSGSAVIDMMFSMMGVICLWLGVMKIAEKSGLIDIVAKKLSKVLKFIFPEIPSDDPSIGYIASNIVMNMLGLGNAATPFGLKAMRELQRLNKNSSVASRSMITFLVINTCSVTIIPTTVISLRLLYGSSNASSILASTIIASTLSVFIALLIDRLFYFLWRRRYD